MRVMFFASVREATNCVEVKWRGTGPVSADELWGRLLQEFPSLAAHRPVVRLARNGEFVDNSAVFGPEDEVALLPPVSGG